jgi:hypothetical protein
MKMKMKPTQMGSLANCSPLVYHWAKELASQFILQFVSQSQSNIYVGVTVKFCKLAVNLKDPGIVPLFLHFLHSEGIVTKHQMDRLDPKVSVVSSATSKYFAPSDHSGTTGYMRELIRATSSYRKKFPRYDTVFVRTGLAPGPHGLAAAQLRLLFSFTINDARREFALVEWFSYVGDSPDEDTGMWVVQREKKCDGSPLINFIRADTIL